MADVYSEVLKHETNTITLRKGEEANKVLILRFIV